MDQKQRKAEADWLHERLVEAGVERVRAAEKLARAMRTIQVCIRDADQLQAFSKLEMARLAQVDPKTVYKMLERGES